MPNRQKIRRDVSLPAEPDVTTAELVRRRRLWPTDEAAYQLGVARSTLYDWRRSGLINFVKVGGRTFVSDIELDRFVARAEATLSA
jgi:excisionase family DNA binding protein